MSASRVRAPILHELPANELANPMSHGGLFFGLKSLKMLGPSGVVVASS